MSVLPTLAAGSVDAVVTDPPYGIGYSPRQNSSKAWGPKTFVGDVVVAGDDVDFDPTPFLGFPVVVLCGANHFANRLPPSSEWIVWDKREGVTSNDFADCEMIWTNQGGVARVFRHMWMGALRASERNEPRIHPTQKPVALMEWILERYTKPGDTVLDPYFGSGSTGVACVHLGRNFIGIERDKRHFEAGSRRIEQARAQLALPLFPVEQANG